MAGSQKQTTVSELAEQFRVERANFEERIAELELALEDRGWLSWAGASEREFTREGLRRICKESFLFYLKNPLVKRGVDTQANYVFGQGVTIRATHPVVDEVLQHFLADPKNKVELTTVLAMRAKEIDLWIDANLFFVFFVNRDGDVRVRTIPFDEIEDIRSNPEDKKEPWFYVRKWQQREEDGGTTFKMELYPDWHYRPQGKPAKVRLNGQNLKVNWETPVYHVKVNAARDQKFGTSEIYAAQDWARAYNKFLSDWATIVRSYAKFAWDIVKKGGPAARAAAKAKLDSKISQGDLQPAPAAGSFFISSEGTELKPLRTAGATTSAEDGRRLLLMVCAATGTFEHFMGDPSTGNLATARTLNRPMELQFKTRQLLWEVVVEETSGFVIRCKAEVGHGDLSGEWMDDAWEEEIFIYADDVNNEDADKRDKPIDTNVEVTFPKLVEDDVGSMVEAIAKAATLGGAPLAGTLSREYATEQFLHALGETSVEQVMARLFPDGEEPEAVAVAEAVGSLQGAIEALSESLKRDKNEVVEALAKTFVLAFNEAKGKADGEDSD